MNANMRLDEFKQIFWMEWGHRFLGRILGIAFAGPLAYFAYKGYIGKTLGLKLSAILAGIGFEGALGWYMVRSGLK